MSKTVTVRIDDELERRLGECAEASGESQSDIVREALSRHLAVLTFDALRGRVMPFAEARGYLTDEDVFKNVS
jgi:predicted transcriptional regulator